MKPMLMTALSLLLSSEWVFSSSCPTRGNIKDYFLSLPLDRMIIIDDDQGQITDARTLEKNLEIVDLKNGYLELQNKTIIGKKTAALFKNKNGTKTIAVTDDGDSVQTIYAFRCEKGQWIEVKNTF